MEFGVSLIHFNQYTYTSERSTNMKPFALHHKQNDILCRLSDKSMYIHIIAGIKLIV